MSGPKTAMVMAAGLGLRLRPLTATCPKPLIEVGGKALIDHGLDKLAEVGVERAVVNVHAFPDRMIAHLAARARPKVLISDERDGLLETGGGLRKARPLLGENPIWVANADYVWLEPHGPALATVAAAWDPARMDALLLVLPQDRTEGWEPRGDFFLGEDGRLTHRGEAASAPFNYVGYQIFKPALVDPFPPGPFSLFAVWMQLQARGRLYGVTADADWLQVGDPASLERARARLG